MATLPTPFGDTILYFCKVFGRFYSDMKKPSGNSLVCKFLAEVLEILVTV